MARLTIVVGAAGAVALLSACTAFGPEQPAFECKSGGHLDHDERWTLVAPGKFATDPEQVRTLVDRREGHPREWYVHESWLEGSLGHLRICRWVRNGPRHDPCYKVGSWWEFDVSAAQPVMIDLGGDFCLDP
jgi:hypothetical protein